MKSFRYIFAFSLFLYAYSLSSIGNIVIRVGIVTPLEGLLIDQIEASFMRIDQLNNQNSSLISPNVKLEGIWRNPRGNASAAIQSAYELVNTQQIAAMIGSGYSSYTTLSAYIPNYAPNGPIPHCDGSSTSPLLSVKTSYPQFFRTIPTDILCGQSMAQYAVIQKWLNIATIFSDSKYGSGLNTAFVEAAEDLNISILSQLTFAENLQNPISTEIARKIVLNIKESNARIIMYFGQPKDLKILITEAKNEGIYGLGYAWISADAMSNIPKGAAIDYSGLLYFYPKERVANSVATAFESYYAANHTSPAITARYEASYPGNNSYLSASPIVTDYGWFTASCIDALAMYMEAAVQKISQANGISIDDAARVLATGNWSNFFDISQLNQFSNVATPSGFLNYDKNGDRLADYDLFNIDGKGGIVLAGTYATVSKTFTSSKDINWPGNSAILPIDRIDPNSIAVYIAWTDPIGKLTLALFIIGMLIWSTTFAGYLFYSNQKIIKQSSFLVGLIMQMCLFLGYFELLTMLGVPSTLICVANSFIIPVGFSFYYGLLFTKNLRIYKIFHSSAGVQRWNDYLVTLYGFAMASPSIIICIIWASISTPTTLLVKSAPGSYYFTCSSPDSNIQSGVLSTLLAINGIILGCNLFMAFLTRNVNSRYSETKLISLTIYNLTMTLIFSLSIIYTLSLSYNLRAIIKIITIFYVITFNTIATFSVKVYQCATSKSAHTPQQYLVSESGKLIGTSTPNSPSSPILLSEGYVAGVGKNPKLPQSSALLKPVGGLKGFLGENRKVYLRAETDFGLVIYPAIKNNVEDNKTSASSVGECWNGTQAKVVEVLVSSPTELNVQIDKNSYVLTFDEESIAAVWNTYFQSWILKAEGKLRVMTVKD